MKHAYQKLLISVTALLITAFAAGCAARMHADGNTAVTVSAGEHGLVATPVAVPWEGPEISEDTTVAVRYGNQVRPGQVELAGDGSAYLWFVADIPAGESRTFEVTVGESPAVPVFGWEEPDGDSTALRLNGTPVLRYVHPEFDPEDVENTMKPFHHVYAPDGSRLITKGPGGRYSHHRGIYLGYNRIIVDGESYDIWHARNGEHSEHREVEQTRTGPVFGEHSVKISWNDRAGEPFAEETRRVRAFRLPGGGTLIDVRSTLESVAGHIELGGDLHHAGLQFRAAQYVADNPETSRFLRPEPWAGHPADEEHQDTENYVDLPWNAFQFRIEGSDYTVGYFSHPDNPAGAQMSERLYGRFGEFIPHEIDEERPQTLNYRFWVTESHAVTREELEAMYAAYADHAGR